MKKEGVDEEGLGECGKPVELQLRFLSHEVMLANFSALLKASHLCVQILEAE